jgi:hypothetical protein
MNTNTEDHDSGLVLHTIPSHVRPAYTSLVGSLTVESFTESLAATGEAVAFLLAESGFGLTNLDLRLQVALARYTLLGDWQGMVPAPAQDESLFSQWGKTELLIALIAQLEGINVSHAPSYSIELLLMLNMLRPRVMIDRARLGDTDVSSISLIEVSLLAGMGERSVRNAATPKHPQHLQTTQASVGTCVEPLIAHDWLQGRKRYRSTELPTDQADRIRLLQHLRSFDL